MILLTSVGRRCPHQRRWMMSASQAQTALRPFFFEVHPDRFGADPVVRAKNERSLQVFNGFLNELFSSAHFASSNWNQKEQKSISVEFSIRRDGHFRNVRIDLDGTDPYQIIRRTLESCQLSTSGLPSPSSSSASAAAAASSSVSGKKRSGTGLKQQQSSADDLMHELHQRRRRKMSSAQRRDSLLAFLRKHRVEALEKAKTIIVLRHLIDEEVELVMRRTGATEIIWAIDWDAAHHMRRCLTNVRDLLSQANVDVQQTIIFALNGHRLIFGRGTFICCDGSVQFGADDALGAWQRVCSEALRERNRVAHLDRLTRRVHDLLGGPNVIVQRHGNLARNIEQMQSLIVRVNSQPLTVRSALSAELGGDGRLRLEVVSAYGELAVLRDGCLQVPCNVDIAALRAFIFDSGVRRSAPELSKWMENEKLALNELRQRCIDLGLAALSWDSSFELCPAELRSALTRLEAVLTDEQQRGAIDGLSLFLSTGASAFVQTSGTMAIPFDWLN